MGFGIVVLLSSGREIAVRGTTAETSEEAAHLVAELAAVIDSADAKSSWVEIGDGQVRARPDAIIAVSFEEQKEGWGDSLLDSLFDD